MARGLGQPGRPGRVPRLYLKLQPGVIELQRVQLCNFDLREAGSKREGGLQGHVADLGLRGGVSRGLLKASSRVGGNVLCLQVEYVLNHGGY